MLNKYLIIPCVFYKYNTYEYFFLIRVFRTCIFASKFIQSNTYFSILYGFLKRLVTEPAPTTPRLPTLGCPYRRCACMARWPGWGCCALDLDEHCCLSSRLRPSRLPDPDCLPDPISCAARQLPSTSFLQAVGCSL